MENDDGVHRVANAPRIWNQGPRNDCGPYSLAIAADSVCPGRSEPADALRLLRLLRVPGLGATPPWSLRPAGRSLGLIVRGHWLGRIRDLRAAVDAGQPTIILVHPDDVAGCPWYALHYRVVLGYRDDERLPGGGEFYLACSAAASPPFFDGRPGNLAMSYARLSGQWHTYLTPRWYAAVTVDRPT
jgi:hypothetical protein